MYMHTDVKRVAEEIEPAVAAAELGATFTPEEMATWFGFLRVHAALMRQLDEELEARHRLTFGSFKVLLQLAWAPEHRLRISELTAAVQLTQSAVSRAVDRLAHAGFVRREPSPGDARGAYAVLTDEGLAVLREAYQTHLAGVRARFLNHLTHDQQRLLAALWEEMLPGATRGIGPPPIAQE